MRANAMQLQESLAGLDYPVSKEDLVRWAQETGVDTQTLKLLQSLPAEQFQTPADIGDAIIELS
ncbi:MULTISPECIES: DUF2795 domain-containing protein [unclassified Plantactinospora]|uniref:DUF2795 domain-containing protein n=1 Tax=unclassified Plantactinospora TaxID=2631981 RepID=UPI000D17644B|nr:MULTISPECIES: DUF2795 domain-containing protein [unclassified Plantactinospora]AVT30425.1 hypothetical protein C6361_14015 [Plantactinospora sp. BC1]AVT36928.1 hypothetical protein C6W10_11140 [Plantactinospora sp. BB1]